MKSFVSPLMCVIATILLVIPISCSGSGVPPYKDVRLSAERRIEDLLGRMTLEEKVDMLSGHTWMDTRAVPRLGIPALKMADGPLGIRYWSLDINDAKTGFGTTAFPAGIAMAATWDPELVQQEGKAMGQQARALGRNVILGPTVNIARIPHWGRNFEGYGEDPFLASRMAVAFINGIQGEEVIATVKHFAANNQEFERNRVDVKVSDRALQEVYLPAFKAAVQEAGVGSVMSAYNKVNGAWCAENPVLLTDVLRRQWNFKGFVVSDWASTHTTVVTANAGLDVEMPSAESLKRFLSMPEFARAGFIGGFMSPDKLLPVVRSGQVKQSVIDDKVRRILWAMFTKGIFDHPETAPTNIVDTPAQKAVARQAALEGIVLLKNAGRLLPLDSANIRSIAVIGPNAAVARTGGGGSSLATPKTAPVTPLEGLKERAGDKIKIWYALGCSMEGEDKTRETPQARAKLMREAVSLAGKSDVAVLFAGYSAETEKEMSDRKLELPAGQEELIQAVAKANRKTIVVLNSGGPVLMRHWIDQVPALLEAWFPGQETGWPVAAILFGDANPSGRLPVTFPREWNDSPAFGSYPGSNMSVEYAEGIYVGYRHFDAKNVTPLFPFGYGMSYSSFEYSDLSVTPLKVSRGQTVQVTLNLRNTGALEGAEVVQLYVHDLQAAVDRPEKELKSFRRVVLKPGETKVVTLLLDEYSLSYYDEGKQRWVAEPGAFEVQVGSSSRDIKLRGTFELVAQTVQP
jgi:beta-glucosidase